MKRDQFPNAQQTVGSHACGPVSTYNIHKYFGTKITLPEILKDLGVTLKSLTFPSQLANHLRRQSYIVEVLTSCSYVVSPQWMGKPSSSIIDQLTKWCGYNKKSTWLKGATLLLEYMKDGGKVTVLNLTTKVLDDYLDQGYVILACLEESWLWGKRKIADKNIFDDVKGNPRGHFVVLYDKNDHDYRVSDPYPTGLPGREGTYTVSKDTVLTSILLWGATVVAVKK